MNRRGRQRSRARFPIAAYLLGVTLVPLVGMLAPLLTNIERANQQVDAVEMLNVDVASASRWAELRAAIQAERLYIEGAAMAAELGITPSIVKVLVGIDLEAGIRDQTANTDRAIAAAGDDLPVELRDELARIRSGMLPAGDVGAAYDAIEATVGGGLAERRGNVRSTDATLDGVGALQRSVDVLWDVERYRSLTQSQMGVFFDSIVATDAATKDAQRIELAEQQARIDLVLEQLGVRNPSWATRAVDIERSEVARPFTDELATIVAEPAGESAGFDAVSDLGSLGKAFKAANDRTTLVNALFADAEAAVETDADALIHSATRERQTWTIVAIALLALSLSVAIGVSVLIRRPLRRLEHVAHRVSEGQLDDERRVTGGPREIAVVGTALHEVVVSLRSVSERATALASGEMSSTGARDRLPGPLGDAIDATVDRLAESIQQQAALRAQLAYDASHDSLTGLPNRAGVLTELHAAVARAGEKRTTIGVLFVDLDGFKQINDLYGHGTGDALLQEVGRRLKRLCRGSDIVGRLGGDEFIVLLANVDGAADAEQAAQRVATALSAAIELGGERFTIGASVGLTLADGSSPAEVVLAEADLAVYRAKGLGKGRVEAFDPALRDVLAHDHRLEVELRQALHSDDQLSMHYQPIVDTITGTVVQVEALVRWRRPDGQSVSPADFIPIAERSSLIIELGQRVLELVARQLAEWSGDPLMSRLAVTVNVSARELLSADYVDRVRATLARHGVDPAQLMIEITETAVLDDMSLASSQLRALNALGVKVAIDDFGTGYASFAQLAALPVHAIKIDRSFTANLDNETQRALASLMVQAGRTLELDVVAEGVEDHTQLACVTEMGCILGQGYLFARPAPADELRAWYLTHGTANATTR
jgi:diguanylate cyclase (GGDEF)-like protein